VSLQRGEVIGAQVDVGRPEDALAGVLGIPKLQAVDYRSLPLRGARDIDAGASRFPHAENGGGDCRGLLLEHAQLGTIGVPSALQAFDKRRHTVFQFDLGALAADCLGVQVDEDEPRCGTER